MPERPVKSNSAGVAGRKSCGRPLAVLATLLYAVALISFGASQAFAAGSPGCPAASGSNYKIGPGDVLQISVWQKKDLNRVLTVRPDGKISFPLIGDVKAVGLTTAQLGTVVTKQLERYLTNPAVSVVVKQANSFKVAVLGEVQHPGRFRVTSDGTTVLDVLAEAGGFTTYADKGSIGVIRHGQNGTKRIHFRYHKAVSGHPGDADFCVRPGDTIVVP